MKITEIEQMPSVITFNDVYSASGIHESEFRSFHVLAKVRELLELNTPSSVVLEMIELMTANKHEEVWNPKK